MLMESIFEIRLYILVNSQLTNDVNTITGVTSDEIGLERWELRIES